MYKIITAFMGESEIFYFYSLSKSEQADFDGCEESSFIRDKYGKVYNLSDFMRSNGAWYDGYMSADNFSQYIIKINDICGTVKIFYQYQIFIPDKVVKATSKV